MKLRFSLILISICMLNCSNPNTTLYVGTYTNGSSEGIYKYTFNSETGELINKQLAATVSNPSFLSYSPDKKNIYAVNEDEEGTLSSFKIEDNGELNLLNTVSTKGAHPCHIAVNSSSDKAIASNYTGGNASIHTINNNGSLSEAIQVLDHNTDSIVSHVHSVQFFKDQLFVSDLGRNAVYNYQFEGEKYKLIDTSIVEMSQKAGPRHFTITKDGEFIYIINEYANTITSAKRTEGGFTLIENISTLEDNFKGYSVCADIRLSKNERFLYGSNRGENSIVVFNRDLQSGKLSKIQNISVQGDWPRNFTIDPTGKFLLVANQKSNNISVFKRNLESGKLSYMHSVEMDAPVCLLF